MLQIWGRKTSSNVQAVMWCVGELRLDYQRYDIGHVYGGNQTPEFLGMNPNGTVPVIRDGENAPLWESGAILRYLATRYGNAPFWPQDPAGRATVDMWAEWAKINISQNFTGPIFWQRVRTAAKDRDEALIAKGLEKLTPFLQRADKRLACHPWLVGEDFTLADIQFGHLLYRYYDIELDRPVLPALAAYYQRLTTRPAYQKHVMVSYEALRVQ